MTKFANSVFNTWSIQKKLKERIDNSRDKSDNNVIKGDKVDFWLNGEEVGSLYSEPIKMQYNNV